MTPGLMKSSRKRNLMYRKTVGKSRDSISYERYLRYRNMYNSTKKHAKHAYYDDLLTRYHNDIRKTWQVLNTITGRKHGKGSISDTFVLNGNKVSDKATIADEFCTYFTTIGKQYAEAIPKADRTPQSYIGNVANPATIYLAPTGPIEISKIINLSKQRKALEMMALVCSYSTTCAILVVSPLL